MNKEKTIVIDEKTPLLILAGPMFLELLLNTMLNNVDTLMLSHYDEYAVGAVGNANTIMFMMNILFNVIATATSVVVAQYLGARQYEKMNMIYTLAITVNLVIGIMLSSVFCAANHLIMDFLHVSPEMRPHAMIYIYIVEAGRCLNMTFVSSLKAAGAYVFPLIMGIVCNWGLGLTTGYVVGVVLGIGVAGIFIGTATDEIIRGLIVMYYWYKKKWLGKSVVDKVEI